MDKQIYDPIHGYVSITENMRKIIDTLEFQRLRDLKQLGAACFVFPSATHTRFEHSIGVSYLAKIMVENLKKNQPNLKITEYDIELFQIAGLVHDIGHGPFSHLYDNYIISEGEPEHEERGIEIFKNIVKNNDIDLTKEDFKKIVNMISPPKRLQNNWYYQIIANKINQIDVDKVDYILRDCYHLGMKCGGEYERLLTLAKVKHCDGFDMICWPEKVQYDIFTLFSNRYKLHKQVYNHHATKACEFILIDMLKKIQKKQPIFLNLTDSIVTCRLHSEPEFLKNQDKLIKRQHDRLVKELVITNKDYISKKQEVTKYLKKMKDYKYIETKIGFVSSDEDSPMNNVYYYNNSNNGYKINSIETSFMIPQQYREVVVRLYTNYKNKDNCKNIKVWENIKEILEP